MLLKLNKTSTNALPDLHPSPKHLFNVVRAISVAFAKSVVIDNVQNAPTAGRQVVNVAFVNREKDKLCKEATSSASGFELLGRRLDKFEAAVSKCVMMIETTPLAARPMAPPQMHVYGNFCQPVMCRGTGHSYRTIDGQVPERYHAFSSMCSILGQVATASKKLLSGTAAAGNMIDATTIEGSQSSLRTSTLRSVMARDVSCASKVRAACELLEKVRNIKPAEIGNNDLCLYLPQISLLEVSVVRYLTYLNPLMPIFGRASLMNVMDSQYHSTCESSDFAWIVCFDSIILQTLSVKCDLDRAQQSIQQKAAEESLLMSALAKASRKHTEPDSGRL